VSEVRLMGDYCTLSWEMENEVGWGFGIEAEPNWAMNR
jgi:hypothetical protein